MNANHLHDLKGMLYKIMDKNSSWAVKHKVLSKSLWRCPQAVNSCQECKAGDVSRDLQSPGSSCWPPLAVRYRVRLYAG